MDEARREAEYFCNALYLDLKQAGRDIVERALDLDPVLREQAFRFHNYRITAYKYLFDALCATHRVRYVTVVIAKVRLRGTQEKFETRYFNDLTQFVNWFKAMFFSEFLLFSKLALTIVGPERGVNGVYSSDLEAVELDTLGVSSDVQIAGRALLKFKVAEEAQPLADEEAQDIKVTEEAQQLADEEAPDVKVSDSNDFDL